MKSFARRILALVSAAAIILSTIPAVRGVNAAPTTDEPAGSRSNPESAAMENLMPGMLRNVPAAVPLTRQDLCSLVMDSYKTLTGLTDEDLSQPKLVFTDTADTDILNAYHLGLTTGRSNGIFAPEETISRQDFYTVAANLLRVLDYSYLDDIHMDLSVYADSDEIMAYASQPIQVLLCIGVLEADGSGMLAPNQEITIEEALDILDRVVTFYRDWVENPVEPQPYEGDLVAEYALDYVGCRYVSGGQGPNKFDCSGFVYYVYENFGRSLKPGARNQWSILDKSVKKADLLPGDLVFFSRNGRSSGIFHVGIYIGDGEFVHAANSRKGVIVSNLDEDWYARRYLGAKRAI